MTDTDYAKAKSGICPECDARIYLAPLEAGSHWSKARCGDCGTWVQVWMREPEPEQPYLFTVNR